VVPLRGTYDASALPLVTYLSFQSMSAIAAAVERDPKEKNRGKRCDFQDDR